MLKKITVLFVVMMISITSTAQIQRTFFGCTLGVTSESQVIKIMKAKGVKLKWDGDHYLGQNITFAGVRFNGIGFWFKKQKFSQIAFLNYDTSRFDDFSIALRNKYRKYERSDSNASLLIFDDGKTLVSLLLNLYKGYYGLSYVDDKLNLSSNVNGLEL